MSWDKDLVVPRSMIDTDLYKLSMGQAIFDKYPRLGVEYELVNRGKTRFPDGFGLVLQDSVRAMADLRLAETECDFLVKRCGHYLKPTYLDWFRNYRFDPREVKIRQSEGDLKVTVSGPWYRTVFWEVPLMAVISELYFKMTGQSPQDGWEERTLEKGRVLRENKANFVDFGTRRRFSYEVQERVIDLLIQSAGKWIPGGDGVLRGTSNLYLAMKYGLSPIGTFAHEWVMAHAAVYGYRMATAMALQIWAEEFDGQLGVALSDTYGTDEFLSNFTARYANLFTGARQDSGDPLVAMDKLIAHYISLFVDPTTKTFVASDALNIEKVLRIQAHCRNRIRTLFGIGTFLTNDVGVVPLNFVIKLFRVVLSSGMVVPVFKKSDDPGKITGDPSAIEVAKMSFGQIGLW